MIYAEKRHWFHISNKLKKFDDPFLFKPWGSNRSINRDGVEPKGKRIPVAPSIEQCLTALPLRRMWYHIYRTKHKVIAKEPHKVFDSEITQEGWLLKPTTFKYIGSIDIGVTPFSTRILQAACHGDSITFSKKALKKWQTIHIKSWIVFSPKE